MSESSHPPLPPGSESWIRDDCGKLLLLWWPNGSGFVETIECDNHARPWVAARCRCAWLDEAETIRESLLEYGIPGGMLNEMLEHSPETFGPASREIRIAQRLRTPGPSGAEGRSGDEI